MVNTDDGAITATTTSTVATTETITNDNNNNDDSENNSTEVASYINTTMTQNYIASSVQISNPKLCEVKGRSILHSNVQIQNSDNTTTTTTTTNDTPVRIGRYCHIQSNTIFKSSLPSSPSPSQLPLRYYGIDDDNDDPHIIRNKTKSSANDNTNRPTVVTTTAMTTTIGSYTMIGKHCIISIGHAVSIGNQVQIGDYVAIGDHVIIKDNCIVASYTIIPSHTVIPPYTYCYSSDKNMSKEQHLHNDTTTIGTTTVKEQETAVSSHRRHARLMMDVASLPPSIASVLQEQAIMTYNKFALQQKQKQ